MFSSMTHRASTENESWLGSALGGAEVDDVTANTRGMYHAELTYGSRYRHAIYI